MNKEKLLDTIRRSIEGEAWHGPALRDVLKGVADTDAARRPPGGAHSIWEITLHIAAWMNEVTRRLDGHSKGDPQEGDWPVTGGSWPDAVQRVFNAGEGLLARTERLTESELHKHFHMLESIAQHNAYHGGQIMLLRRILRG